MLDLYGHIKTKSGSSYKARQIYYRHQKSDFLDLKDKKIFLMDREYNSSMKFNYPDD